MELVIKMVLTAWENQNKEFNKLLDSLSDEQLAQPIAPGKNTGVYLLGHLVAVSDGMLPLLGIGDKLYPQLTDIFLTSPDSAHPEKPSVDRLKGYLDAVNEQLHIFIQSITAHSWLERHTAVTAEAFEKEPHRNKLNIIISRTNHLAYHLGQLVLLKR